MLCQLWNTSCKQKSTCLEMPRIAFQCHYLKKNGTIKNSKIILWGCLLCYCSFSFSSNISITQKNPVKCVYLNKRKIAKSQAVTTEMSSLSLLWTFFFFIFHSDNLILLLGALVTYIIAKAVLGFFLTFFSMPHTKILLSCVLYVLISYQMQSAPNHNFQAEWDQG